MTMDICDEEKLDNAKEGNDALKAVNAQMLEALRISEVLIDRDIIRDDFNCLAKVRAAIKAATVEDEPPHYRCDDCGFTAREPEFNPARDLGMRMDVGGTYTDRECPKCGALSYPVNLPGRPEEPAAIDTIEADWPGSKVVDGNLLRALERADYALDQIHQGNHATLRLIPEILQQTNAAIKAAGGTVGADSA